MREVKLWFNKPQRISRLTLAKEEYGVWGRATGKTQGPIAHRTSHAANMMPRGATGLVGTTYMQLLDRTLPPLFKSWEKLGYEMDVHYWVRKLPPAELEIPNAIYPVLKPEHTITWWNGHVFHLISQDRPGLANGKNLDAIVCDEARFLNHARYMDDIAPTNRGNREYFGHLAEHHMITMFTDMPTNPQGKWIFEKEQQVDHKKMAQIVNLQLKFNEIEAEYENPLTTPSRKAYLLRKMSDYSFVLNQLRKDTVWYSEASSLDNIQILGADQIRQWRREMLWPVFQASILNVKLIQIENGFYYLLDRDHHGYDSVDYNYIDNLGLYLPNGVVSDCRKDGDLIKGKKLDISFDYNSSIKSLVIGQDKNKAYHFLKSMFVKRKEKKILTDLLDEFDIYYGPHKVSCREVDFFYDHTALVTDATRLETLADIVVSHLVKLGWAVNRRYIGTQPMHHTRYRMWESVFKEKDPRFKPVRFNKDNCASLLISMEQTGVRQGKKGFEKDKRPETNASVAPEDAPHLGDAADTLYIGKFQFEYGYDLPIMDMITS